ncbi:MAG: 4-(cytidine 5'-diphospho)-2-C-methyl-D-erythritol kinase [Acidimicrobiales bacterium]
MDGRAPDLPPAEQPAPVTVLAPAKLTVSLRLVGLRDDGYHLIDAEMVSLDLADVLELHPGGDGVEVRVPAGGAAAHGLVIDQGEDNLVAKALRLVGRRARVVITKHIPAGAGLGGGSADAAAVLRWAGFDDPVAAAGLGADVAFCLRNGRARVRGIGEQLDPLPYERRTFTLVTPPFGCSTVAVYRAWDRLGGPQGDNGNDLEPAALTVEPRLAFWRDELAAATGQRPRLAGSGSTWFVEGAHPGAGRTVVTTTP